VVDTGGFAFNPFGMTIKIAAAVHSLALFLVLYNGIKLWWRSMEDICLLFGTIYMALFGQNLLS